MPDLFVPLTPTIRGYPTSLRRRRGTHKVGRASLVLLGRLDLGHFEQPHWIIG